MANSFTLDDIRAAAEKKYGSTVIGGVEFLNPLRLPKSKRDALIAAQEKMSEDGADQEALIREVLTLAAKSPTEASALMADMDLAMLATMLEHYGKETEAGEA